MSEPVTSQKYSTPEQSSGVGMPGSQAESYGQQLGTPQVQSTQSQPQMQSSMASQQQSSQQRVSEGPGVSQIGAQPSQASIGQPSQQQPGVQTSQQQQPQAQYQGQQEQQVANVPSQAGIQGPISSKLAPGQMAHMTSVLITGATGSTGTAILQELDRIKKTFNVVVGVHAEDQEELQQKKGLLSKFDRIIRLDADVQQTLDFRGIDILVIIPPNSPNRVNQVRNYVRAAKVAAVKYIVLLSLLGSEEPMNDFSKQFQEIENIVEDSEIPCTFIRSNFYMENLFLQAPAIQLNNAICLPLENGRWAPVAIHDVALAICSILQYPEPHLNKAYDITGPELLFGQDIAAIASQELGKQLTFDPADHQTFCNMLMRQGVPNWLACGMCQYYVTFARERRLDQVDSGSFFRDLTGRHLTSLRDWFRNNKAVFDSRLKLFAGGAEEGIPGVQPSYGTEKQQPPVQLYEAERRPQVAAQSGGGQQVPSSEVKVLADVLSDLINEELQLAEDRREYMDRFGRRLGRLTDLRARLDDILKVKGSQWGIGGQRQQQYIQPQRGGEKGQVGAGYGQQLGRQPPGVQQESMMGQQQQPIGQQQQQAVGQQPWRSEQEMGYGKTVQQQPGISQQQPGVGQRGGMLGTAEPWSQIGAVGQQQGRAGQQQAPFGQTVQSLFLREHGINA